MALRSGRVVLAIEQPEVALSVSQVHYSPHMAAPHIGLWPPPGGETGALIREHDWASSPLGPMERWPAALKVAVGMMLGSPRALAIYWGPDYICLYNDAYRELLGEKHPIALGRPAREVFPEARELIGPMFRRVLETGEPASAESQMLPLERGRASLEAWFTYTAEPIFDEDGSVVGILNPASEVSLITQERRERRAAEARGDELARQIESQRRASEAYRERESHFRRIADAAPALLWVTGEDNKCTYLSRTWYEFTGMEADEAMGFGWFKAIHPEDRKRTSDQFMEARTAERPFQLNHRMRHHDGGYRWVLDSGAPRYDQFGAFLGYVGSIIDVDDRQRAEEALHRSVERSELRLHLADVLRLTDDEEAIQEEATALLARNLHADRVFWGDLDADGDHVHIRVEQRSARATGSAIGVRELREFGRFMVDLLMSGQTITFDDVATDSRLNQAQREAAQRLGIGASIEVPVLRAGSLASMLVVYQSEPRAWTPDEVAFVEETAERTQTALERTAAERRLQASEERFRRLADSMPQLVWIADLDGSVTYYNVRGDGYDGLVHESDGTWDWQAVVHPEDQELTTEAWEAAVRGDAPYECEHRIRLKDGSYRWHLSRAELVETDGVTQWYGTATDIHELKLADELKDRFLAIASHELRNPVSVIHGTAQQIRRARSLGTLSEERFETYLDSLVETSAHLATLTNDLTDVSRLQRGSLPLNLEPTDIAALVRDVASHEDWAPRVRLAPIEGAVVIEADRHRMRQVVTNLVDNALKYSPEETPVEISLLPDRDGALIEVKDYGIGFSPNDLDAIFTPFGRAANSGAVPGLGMGLFIAREIVERHGGDLRAMSEGEGLGATMSLWLPGNVPTRLAQDS